MAVTRIYRAQSEADIATARALCRAWLDWHWENYPADGPREDHPLDPERFEQVLQDLPRIHARPQGAILLAEVDDEPAGCVMYHAAAPGVAEIKRLFVADAGRGHGLGALLLSQMFDAMIADGYRTVQFSSARFLTHARRLYESVGFTEIDVPPEVPEAHRHFVYFMERPLV